MRAHSEAITMIAFSVDGAQLVSWSYVSRPVRIAWGGRSGRIKWGEWGHTNESNSASLTNELNGVQLVSGSYKSNGKF